MKTTLSKIITLTFAILALAFTFCFTSSAAEADKGADIYVNDEVLHYDSVSEAWSKLVSLNETATLRLRENWLADEDGNMGTGKGFSDGAIAVKSLTKKITIDLNGFKIDRGLTKAEDNGNVFYIFNSKCLKITDSSDAKTGLITGGCNKEAGGAFAMYGSILELENITVAGNTSETRGGGLYISGAEAEETRLIANVFIYNCTFTNNKATTGGAIYMEVSNDLEIYDSIITGNYAKNDAGIHTEVFLFSVSTITLGGKVIIADNIAENDGTGLMLDESTFRKVYVKYNKNRPLSKESRITILSKTGDNTLRITADSSEYYFECYEYENGDYTIIEKGSGNEKYLDIKKN